MYHNSGHGFDFGSGWLRINGNPMNTANGGYCNIGDGYYKIEKDAQGNNPLTGDNYNNAS